ncbi:MAG: hypothetical protein CSA75_02140 [Sorangium cellulosum]|nr:MAG: hypothetical protein CSA75_02140 [Sorangium cellulosum]
MGCNNSTPEPPCECVQSLTAVDAPLMAFLSKTRAAHHQADQREESGDIAGAIRALESITSTQLGRTASRPEAKEVLADTQARLADLQGQLGNYEDAEKSVSQGLKLAPRDSFFEGHLYEMRGVNEERRSKALAELGDKVGAEAAKQKALSAFDKVIDIQERVIRRELADAGGAP